MYIVIVLAAITIFYFGYRRETAERKLKLPAGEFSPAWRMVLDTKVAFYGQLDAEEKKRFEQDIIRFLSVCRITGIQTEVDDTDRLLVASSAVIPVFYFPDWEYSNLCEVLLYPSSFNEKFEFAGPDRSILGMVGTGYMDGKMILSRPALRHGFENESDKQNTALHEFIHLVDKMDGSIDGVPEILLQKQYAIPWFDLVYQEMEKIHAGKSDVNPYGGTSRVEFFAVISEYFFEHPQQLKAAHPELYEILGSIFRQDPGARKGGKNRKQIGRNDPCPCGSGKKFKKCCGAVHFPSRLA